MYTLYKNRWIMNPLKEQKLFRFSELDLLNIVNFIIIM